MIAARVQEHFARRRAAELPQAADRMASPPDGTAIETLVEAAFWASLRREEGYVPKISLALLQPEQTVHPLIFERPFLLEPTALTKLAPAVESPGIHLGIWPDRGAFRVWGTTRNLPILCLVVEVAAPGLLVIKHRRGEEHAKFANIAVLEGDQAKIIDEGAFDVPGCPPLLHALGVDSLASWTNAASLLVRLALAMRAHGRGGSLLIVPSGSEAWRTSVVHPISYAVSPPFAELAHLVVEHPGDLSHPGWFDAVDRSLEMIANLTAVDGATVMTDRCELLAFGAKITRRDGGRPIERLTITEPIEGAATTTVHPIELGGTRHLSAAQFVHDQRAATALVASQDGRFTAFGWSSPDEIVRAYRVDVLLV